MLSAKPFLASVVLSVITAPTGGQQPTAPAVPHATYQLVDLGTLGGPTSHAIDINNQGEVVGEAEIARSDKHGQPISHAFLWKDGRMIDIGFAGYAQAVSDRGSILCGAVSGDDYLHLLIKGGKKIPIGLDDINGLNDKDEVVGSSDDRACIWHNGRRTFLRTGQPRAVSPMDALTRAMFGYLKMSRTPSHMITTTSAARAINAAGVVVGDGDRTYITTSGESNYRVTAYLWKNGSRKSLYGFTAAQAINASGQVVGREDFDLKTGRPLPKDGECALLWSKGVTRNLGVLPGRTWSSATGINDSGQVVGSSGDRACVWDQNGDKIADLNRLTLLPPGWVLKSATKINNRGQIIGQGLHTGQEHAFLLNPLPSPNVKRMLRRG